MARVKTNPGYFFEDFKKGMPLPHATPRTITEGEVALYTALYGTRFAVNSSVAFAQSIGLPTAPIDDLLVFHIVFGKTVPDISLNAVANLGYADCRFLAPVYAGDTLNARSEVMGIKENSNGKTGVVYVRSQGVNQRGEPVLDYVRWVMVNKRDNAAPAPAPALPVLPEAVDAQDLPTLPETLKLSAYNTDLSGSADLWEDYEVGEKIDHVDGMTIEEAEHMLATRLYQNTAKVHFDQLAQAKGRFGKRLIYGGHVISLARSLSFNGLANAFHVAAINGGRHVAPCFAGDTVYAWSEILGKAELAGRKDAGALRVRLIATKNHSCAEFPLFEKPGEHHPAVILDLDYWLVMPRHR
jgi:2-methylfumaryl-CoA hydratase